MQNEPGAERTAAHTIEARAALGANLMLAREAAELTQAAAAAKLGLVKQTISSWEKGRNLPDALWLQRLAELYKTSADVLTGNEAALWPFRRVDKARILALEQDDLAYVEGKLSAALDEIEQPNQEDLAQFAASHGHKAKPVQRRKTA